MGNIFSWKDRWGNSGALYIVASMTFLLPLSIWALTFVSMENEVHNWVANDNKDTEAFKWYKQNFSTDEVVLFTYDGSHLHDPRINDYVKALRGRKTADGTRRGGAKYVDKVRNPLELIDQMKKRKVTDEEAANRLSGVLLGPGLLRVRLTDTGRTHIETTTKLLVQKLAEQGLKVEVVPAQTLTSTAAATAAAAPDGTPKAKEPGEDEEPFHAGTEVNIEDEPLRPLAPPLPHDFQLKWAGIRPHHEAIPKVKVVGSDLRLPSTNPELRTQPLIEAMFFQAGTPVALAITLNDAGKTDRRSAFAEMFQIAEKVGIPSKTIRMGGSPVAGQELNRGVVKAVWNTEAPIYMLHRRSILLLSGVVGGILAVWLLRSIRLAIIVLGVSYFTTLLATALVPITGGSMNMVLVVMPTLQLVTTICGAIHVANYWQHAAAARPKTAIQEAVSASFSPVFWSAVTTAIGQASLASSSLIPIRDFGIYTAIGSVLTCLAVLVLLPAMLQLWPPRIPKLVELDDSGWYRYGLWVANHSTWVITASLVVTLGCAAGLYRFRTETKVIRYFDESSKIVQDYNYLEENLAGIIPVDVIVRFDKPAQEELKFLERRELIRRIQREIAQIRDISGTLSLSDFLPDLEPPSEKASVSARARYAAQSLAIEEKVKGKNQGASAFLKVAESKSKLNDAGDELWRITAQVAIMTDLHYGDLTAQLDEICRNVLRTVSGQTKEQYRDSDTPVEFHPGASHVVTGMVPVFLATQDALLNSFLWSFGGAFGLIALVLIGLMRHPVAGMLALIPNILPIVGIFGLIAWCGLRIDIGSTISASIALGITIDGTLHVVTWFRDAIIQGKTRAQAAAISLQHCGPAMWQTTVVISLGLIMLYPADLILVSRFGWLMSVLLLAASVTDLCMTPALLAGPLGYLVEKSIPAGARTHLEESPMGETEETVATVPSIPSHPPEVKVLSPEPEEAMSLSARREAKRARLRRAE